MAKAELKLVITNLKEEKEGEKLRYQEVGNKSLNLFGEFDREKAEELIEKVGIKFNELRKK